MPKMMHGYLVSIHDVARAEAYKRFADMLTSGEIVDRCGTFDELEKIYCKHYFERLTTNLIFRG